MKTKIISGLIISGLLLASMMLIGCASAGSNGISISGQMTVEAPNPGACTPNFIGVGINNNLLNFGVLQAGNIATSDVVVALTTSGYGDCIIVPDPAPVKVPVLVTASDWVSTTDASHVISTSHVTITGLPTDMDELGIYPMFPIGNTLLSFKVDVPIDATPDTYSEIISITAIY